MTPHARFRLSLTMLAALAFASANAAAVQFRVGTDTACSHATLQAAVNALPASGAHEIRIANSTTYTAQAITISARTVTMRGGYATCDAAGGGTRALLSGAGGSSNSVLTIGGSGNDIILEDLNLIRGDEVASGNGGGIDFRGTGTLTLRNVGISQNYAGYGGGIHFAAENGTAELRIEAGTTILLNTAQYSGGGVRLEGRATMTMVAPNSSIADNDALGINPANNQPMYGTGGGVMVVAPAKAYIASSGIGNGTIVGNRARYGGGVGVVGSDETDDNAYLYLYSVDPLRPVRVYGNRASNTGGGIFADTVSLSTGLLCSFDVRIDGNVAQEGSAIYADSDFGTIGLTFGSRAFINTDAPEYACTRPMGSVRCAAGVPCSTIEGNRTENSAGNATAGAAILVQNDGYMTLTRVSIRNNVGAHALRAFEANIGLGTVAMAGNTLSGPLLRLEDESTLRVADATLAGNTIAASQVISLNGSLDMRRSILWQPGKTSLTQSDGSRTLNQVFASEIASLGAGASATPPRLVDPDRGDVRLRASSLAVDYLEAIPGNDFDVENLPRNRRLDVIPRTPGFVRDLGAHERQTVAPLLYNTDFDVDGNLWTSVTPGVSTWDGTQNVTGAAGSGSIKATQDNATPGQRVTGLHQCIHLPGPGTYALNGYGRSGAGTSITRDYVYLNWAFRRSGSESCTSGPATSSGNLFLSNSASWQRPANPALITVSAADWTTTSSIDVTHVVVENGISVPATAIGWFDGITLDYVDPNDTIFRNGFD
jgi:hypothetical protein